MKVIAINGSPRRRWNTAQLCQAALEGAAAAGAETELIHLETMKFKGCMSCYACHSKKKYDTKVCYYKDELTETLNKCIEADAIIIGTPIYYGFATGDVRAFMERLMFPIDTYEVDREGYRPIKLDRIIPTAMIYTMNASEPFLRGNTALAMNESELRRMFGYSESYYAYDVLVKETERLRDSLLHTVVEDTVSITQVISDMPRGTSVSDPTGKLGSMLAEGYVPQHIRQVEEDLEKMRMEIPNLVECVKAYDIHEYELILAVVRERGYDTGEVQNMVAAVAEAYPNMKSSKNYLELMNELSTTENMIANFRSNYNRQVRAYKQYVRKFPNATLLVFSGYDCVDYDYLVYDLSDESPFVLFD